jgi:NADH-quinone oxidoreductase subunit J
MVYVALFVIVALLELISATLIFVFKDVLHTILAFAFIFIFNSAIFLMLGEPLLAILQLFIMVGGVSTYAFVGIASGTNPKFKSNNYLVLVAIFLIIAVSFSIIIMRLSPVGNDNILSISNISSSISSNIGLFYLITLMLFGVGFGSIIIFRRLGKK